jgi:ATP-binding cassette subfamily C protein CydC
MRLHSGELVARIGACVDELSDVLVRAVLPIAVAAVLSVAAVAVIAVIPPLRRTLQRSIIRAATSR